MSKLIDMELLDVETASLTTDRGMNLATRSLNSVLTDPARACDLTPQIQGYGTNILTAPWALEGEDHRVLALAEGGDIP